MLAEIFKMFIANPWAELGLLGAIIMIFAYGYWVGLAKAGAKYEAEIDRLSDKQVDPAIKEITMLRLKAANERGGKRSWDIQL